MAGSNFLKPRTIVLCLALSLAASATPQVTMRGRILDATGAPIAGARITALDGPVTVSDQSGHFTLSLDPGNYLLKIAADGFEPFSEAVQFRDTGAQVREFVLQVAARRESVTVTDSARYQVAATRSATKTLTPLRDVPQSITVVTGELMKDQMMASIGDVVRYTPGITAIQGENNRDQVVIRGNSSSADFFVDGMRDDVQYYRDLYNLDRVEALKGPNAMIFGRGGGGGVINRVTKEAGFTPLREISIEGGSYDNKRFTTDFDQPLNDKLALRFNGLYENSGSFRKYVGLKRFGLAPAVAIAASHNTRITLSFEHFRDDRVADRGIPSFQGRPADVALSTYYGNPKDSHAGARVNLVIAALEHQAGRLTIRNQTLAADYDRGYQNFVPRGVTTDQKEVELSAYNNATRRRNIFNQTDLSYPLSTGRLRHTLLAGFEVGHQLTDNFRNTGYFNDTSTSIFVPYDDTVLTTPVNFRQSATDADNHLEANVRAAYVQDQVEITRHLQGIVGLRFDNFDLRFHNNRTDDRLRRIDNLASPRAGLVYKPITPVSIYVNYSVSYLPSSGDQFSSLTSVTEQAKPEKFNNYEAGVKWDVAPSLSLTAAAYRLDRTNTRATDPNDPTRIVQTGSQRTNGFELGWNGSVTRAWRIAGGYAYQDAFVTSTTVSALVGAQVAQVPHHSFSLWNQYQVRPRLGAGLGILNRTDMFAAIDNTVVLPGYARVDAAVYYSLTEKVRLQANVENLFNRKYYMNADNNNNISPGSPRAVRVGLIARF